MSACSLRTAQARCYAGPPSDWPGAAWSCRPPPPRTVWPACSSRCCQLPAALSVEARQQQRRQRQRRGRGCSRVPGAPGRRLGGRARRRLPGGPPCRARLPARWRCLCRRWCAHPASETGSVRSIQGSAVSTDLQACCGVPATSLPGVPLGFPARPGSTPCPAAAPAGAAVVYGLPARAHRGAVHLACHTEGPVPGLRWARCSSTPAEPGALPVAAESAWSLHAPTILYGSQEGAKP